MKDERRQMSVRASGKMAARALIHHSSFIIRHSSRAFTLIELILVMAVLAMVFAIAAPRLAGFMKGREVDEELRRLMALTRYARSEAIGRGERVELWIAPEDGVYGVRSERTGETESKELRFELAERVGLSLGEDQQLDEQKEAVILFWPDGTIDEEAPLELKLTEDEQERYVIALGDNRLEYVAEVAGE